MFGIRKGKTGKHGKTQAVAFDLTKYRAVLKCSICTGEQVAGFQDVHTGKFEEVMLIRDQADLRHFKEQYGVEEISKIY